MLYCYCAGVCAAAWGPAQDPQCQVRVGDVCASTRVLLREAKGPRGCKHGPDPPHPARVLAVPVVPVVLPRWWGFICPAPAASASSGSGTAASARPHPCGPGAEGTFRSSVSWHSVDPLLPPLCTGHWCTHGAVVPHGHVPHGHVPAHLHCIEQVAPVQLDHLAVLLLRVLKESEQAWAWGRDLGTHQAPRYPPPASPPAPGSWTAWQRCRGGSAALPWTLGEHSGPPSA